MPHIRFFTMKQVAINLGKEMKNGLSVALGHMNEREKKIQTNKSAVVVTHISERKK